MLKNRNLPLEETIGELLEEAWISYNEAEEITDVHLDIIKFLLKKLWQTERTPTQLKLIAIIGFAFPKYKRLIVSAMTRYGKSDGVSLGVCIYLLLHTNKRVLLIGPKQLQTNILRNYISNWIVKSSDLANLLDVDVTGVERLKKEVSKTRITFKNGCEVMTLSAEGEADRLMGFGGDMIIEDESCLIAHSVFRQKISRMLGDSPDSIHIELGNPWHKDNHMWENWTSERYIKIHIDWRIALAEGRITQEFLDEQREKLTDREFRILYESLFPEASKDVLITRESIDEAIKRVMSFNSSDVKRYIGVDVARYGTDKTVITVVEEYNGMFKQIYTEEWSDKGNPFVAGRVIEVDNDYNVDLIRIDDAGLGGGVTDILRTSSRANKTVAFIANGRDEFTEDDKERFSNWKTKAYFHLARLFKRGTIRILENRELMTELSLLRIDYGNGQTNGLAKPRILDFPKEREPVEGEKHSPNYSDSLMIACCGYGKDLATGSGSGWV